MSIILNKKILYLELWILIKSILIISISQTRPVHILCIIYPSSLISLPVREILCNNANMPTEKAGNLIGSHCFWIFNAHYAFDYWWDLIYCLNFKSPRALHKGISRVTSYFAKKTCFLQKAFEKMLFLVQKYWIFLLFLLKKKKNMMWILIRSASIRSFWLYSHSMFLWRNKKNIYPGTHSYLDLWWTH